MLFVWLSPYLEEEERPHMGVEGQYKTDATCGSPPMASVEDRHSARQKALSTYTVTEVIWSPMGIDFPGFVWTQSLACAEDGQSQRECPNVAPKYTKQSSPQLCSSPCCLVGLHPPLCSGIHSLLVASGQEVWGRNLSLVVAVTVCQGS